jgi:hypothetical protein
MPTLYRRSLRAGAPLAALTVLLALAAEARAISPFPRTPYAPAQAVSRLAGPYVLWSVAERDGQPVRIECVMSLTDGDLAWARTGQGAGPGSAADPFFAAEVPGGQNCTGPVFMAQGIQSGLAGGWSIGMGGSIRLLQANAAPMDFRPGMVPGEYALAQGKVYLTALRAPSTLGREVASPLGGPGFGFAVASPAGWTSTLDPATATLIVTAPGTAPATGLGQPALPVLPLGKAACLVARTPTGRGYDIAVTTQEALNALARERAGRTPQITTYPIRAPKLQTGAVERGNIVGIQRTWTGPGEGEPYTQIELEWSTPEFSVAALCGAGAPAEDALGQTIADFIAGLTPDTR